MFAPFAALGLPLWWLVMVIAAFEHANRSYIMPSSLVSTAAAATSISFAFEHSSS